MKYQGDVIDGPSKGEWYSSETKVSQINGVRYKFNELPMKAFKTLDGDLTKVEGMPIGGWLLAQD